MPEDLVALILAQQQQIADLAAAMQRQAEAISALAPRPEVGADLTVAQLREGYESVVKTRASAVSLRIHLKPWCAQFGQRLVLSLRATEIVEFRDGPRLQSTERDTQRAPGTRNAEVIAFLAMVNWGVREGLVARNPIGRIKALPVTPRETVIAREDEPSILRASSPEERVIFLLGVDAGMRLNEIRLLEWEWVDFAERRVHLPAWVTKTRKARSPRITSRTADALRQLTRMLRVRYVLPNPKTGDPYCKQTIGAWWRRMRDEADLQPAPGEHAVTFHATRHTAATRINKVAGFKVAMKQLGQTSASVALKYVHASETDLDDMSRKLDEISGSPRRPPQRAEPRTEKKQEAIE